MLFHSIYTCTYPYLYVAPQLKSLFHFSLVIDDVIDISSDEDDIMLSADNEEDIVDNEDPNNAGSHIDDSLNHPDEEGRVLINIGHPPDEPDIFLAPQIAKYIKRHQVKSTRYMTICTFIKHF